MYQIYYDHSLATCTPTAALVVASCGEVWLQACVLVKRVQDMHHVLAAERPKAQML